MRTLWRKSRRDLVAARWQALGLALLVTLAMSLLLGAARGRRTLSESFETCLERLNAADLDVRCSPTLPGAIESVRALPGVTAAEERMLLDGLLRSDGRPSVPARVQVLQDSARPEIFSLEVTAGRWPERGEEALLIDRSLRAVQGIDVGDRVTLEILGDRRELPVVGIVLGSEHALLPVHPEYDIPIPGTLAVLYLSPAAARHYRYTDRIDSLLLRFAPDADAEALQRAVLDKLNVAVLGVLTPDQDPVRFMGRSAINTYGIYMPVSIGVLLSIALALFLITLARVIHMQRRQLGILIALGHRRLPLALSLLPLSVVPVAVGFLGALLLHGVIARLTYDAHADSLGWAPLVDSGLDASVAWAGLVALGVAVLGCLVPALVALRRRPGALLRHDARHMPAGTPLRRLARAIAGHVRFPLHVVLGLRSVLRRRWVTTVTALALGANFALVLAFVFVNLSHTVESQATFDRVGLTGVAYFSEPVAEEKLRAAAPATWDRIEPTITALAYFRFASGPSFVRLLCLQPDGWIRRFPIAAGRPFAAGDAPSVHVDRWLADRHGLAVGDRVLVFPSYSAPEGLEVEVAGIFGGVSLGFAAMALETGRELYQMPGRLMGIHVATTQPREALIDALQALPDVQSVLHLEDARMRVSETFAGARFIITLTLFMAVFVAMVFLGILASLDAADRARDLAILRALGWRNRTVLGLCLTEVVSRGLLALLLALPAAPLLARWMLHQIREASHYRMPMHDPAWLYALVAGLVLLIIPFGAVPALRAARALPTGRVVRLLGAE